MNRLAVTTATLVILVLLGSSADAGWWHHRCWYSQVSGAGAYGVAPTGAAYNVAGTGQGIGEAALGSLLTELLRRQLPNLPILNPLQGVETQLATLNTTLSAMNSKLDNLAAIADALKRKNAATHEMPADSKFNPAPTIDRPITPPPQGASAPSGRGAAAVAELESKLEAKLDTKLGQMQKELADIKAALQKLQPAAAK